jgi:hypothetical protein
MRLILNITDEMVVALDDDEAGRMHAEQIRNGKHVRGKQTERGYSSRIYMRFFDYSSARGEKDLGGMDDMSIRHGLYNAKHSILADLANEQQRKDRRTIPGTASSLSGARRQGHGRPRAVSADHQGGMR